MRLATHAADESALETVERALPVLDSLAEPFFFWLHFRQPHAPFEADERLYDEFFGPSGGEPTTQRDPYEEVLEHFSQIEETASYVLDAQRVELTPTMLRQYVTATSVAETTGSGSGWMPSMRVGSQTTRWSSWLRTTARAWASTESSATTASTTGFCTRRSFFGCPTARTRSAATRS